MSTLYKRATPAQHRVLRIVEGAVKNASDAHELEISPRHRRSIAKRAAGTLTAQWPDVLAAKKLPESGGAAIPVQPRRRRRSEITEADGRGVAEASKRSPLKPLRNRIVCQMTAIRVSGDLARYEAYREILRLIAEMGCPR
jgi:hypothetical protein